VQKPFLVGAGWLTLACLISVINDSIVKAVSSNLPTINILFLKFLFSFLSLMPFLKADTFQKALTHKKIHFLRGASFAIAMLPWCYGLIQLPLPLMTCLNFSTPLFVTLLAAFFLKERFTLPKIAATVLGFLGIVVSVGASFSQMSVAVFWALCATFLFASLDIANKKLLNLQENRLVMMIAPTFWSAAFLLPFAFYTWQTPSVQDLAVLAVLGVGGNLLFFCFLKAFSCYQVSALQPFKYTEFLFSCAASLIFFQYKPTWNLMMGTFLIIASTFYLSWSELKKISKTTNPLSQPA
jgi:S-adenosylmethionine uptake transporter